MSLNRLVLRRSTLPRDPLDLPSLPVGDTGLALWGLCWPPGAQTSWSLTPGRNHVPCSVLSMSSPWPQDRQNQCAGKISQLWPANELHTLQTCGQVCVKDSAPAPCHQPAKACSHHWPPCQPALPLLPAGRPAPQGVNLPRCLLLRGLLQRGRQGRLSPFSNEVRLCLSITASSRAGRGGGCQRDNLPLQRTLHVAVSATPAWEGCAPAREPGEPSRPCSCRQAAERSPTSPTPVRS